MNKFTTDKIRPLRSIQDKHERKIISLVCQSQGCHPTQIRPSKLGSVA